MSEQDKQRATLRTMRVVLFTEAELTINERGEFVTTHVREANILAGQMETVTMEHPTRKGETIQVISGLVPSDNREEFILVDRLSEHIVKQVYNQGLMNALKKTSEEGAVMNALREAGFTPGENLASPPAEQPVQAIIEQGHTMTLTCDVADCDKEQEFRGRLRRDEARAAGWNIGASPEDPTLCPKHADKE